MPRGLLLSRSFDSMAQRLMTTANGRLSYTYMLLPRHFRDGGRHNDLVITGMMVRITGVGGGRVLGAILHLGLSVSSYDGRRAAAADNSLLGLKSQEEQERPEFTRRSR